MLGWVSGAHLNPALTIGFAMAGFYIWSLGLSLGGPTGYAINPARDLGPRIIHSILPMKNKGDSDWSYSWVPVFGPIVGGILGALAYVALTRGANKNHIIRATLESIAMGAAYLAGLAVGF